MAGSEENCLICSGKGVPSRSPIFSAANGECQENDCLNHEIQVMLLLRKVLGIRKGFLELVLQSSEGRDPSSWDLKLCHVCLRIFEEVMFVWERLCKLQGEFDEMSKRLRLKMLQFVEGEEFKNMGQQQQPSVVTGIKRKAGRPPRKKPMIHIPEQDNISISMKIRSEFARLHSKETPKPDNNCLQTNRELSTMPKLKRESLPVIIDQFQMTAADDSEVYDVPKEITSNAEDQTFQDLFDEIDTSYLNDDGMDVPSPAEGDERQEGENEDCQEFNESQKSHDDNDLPDSEFEPPGQDDDSDFEPSPRPRTRTKRISRKTKRTSRKRKAINTEDGGAVIRAIKMENTGSYQCSECTQTFSNSLQCDEHILHEHHDGTWPQLKFCPLCGNSFKGETWLRQHLKVRHPDYKLPTDEVLQQCIKEGTVPEITYECVPFGDSKNQLLSSRTQPPCQVGKNQTIRDRSLNSNKVICGEGEPPANRFNVPYFHTKGGRLCYLIPPNSFSSAMPEHVLAQLKRGSVDKQCDRCDKSFPTELQLKAHIKRYHEGDRLCWSCPICPKTFKWIKEIIVHLQKTHVNGKFVCKKCGNMFREEVLLRAHIQRVHLGIANPFACIKCGLKYPTRSSVNKHLQLMHKLQIVLPDRVLKAVALRASRNYPKHNYKNRSKRAKIVPCEICAKSGVVIKFTTEEQLDVHMKRMHKGTYSTYPCPVCRKKFSRPVLLDKHLQTHAVRSDVAVDMEPQKEEFVCHPCNKSYSKKHLYEAHLKGRNHEYVRPFVCELCSESFRTILYLENHQSLKHHEELQIEPFKCKFCDKILGSEKTLKEHTRRTHTKDANFKCPHCDVYCEHEKEMDMHITIKHSNRRDFLCPYCPKAFAAEYYLKNHIRIHTGEKPYECKTCSKKFADKPTYNRHVEAHSDIIHDCPHCGKTGFKTRHALRVHMKKVHQAIVERLDREAKQNNIATSSTSANLMEEFNNERTELE